MGRPSTAYEVTCKTCEEIFLSKVSAKRIFCSKICYVKRDNNLSLNAKCGYCGVKFHAQENILKAGKGKFCSLECYGKSQRRKTELICQICKKPYMALPSHIKRGSKYCSHKCSEIAHRGNGNGMWVESVKLVCEYCEKIYYMKPWESRNGIRNGSTRKYCSQYCQYEGIKGENHPNWLGGISWEPYGMAFNENLKEKIRNRDNYTCQVDECHEKQNGKKFHVHHINYCKQNNEDYNLITLCHSHHTKSNFNREFWEGYFYSRVQGE